ncbi:carboxypeptidase-like regulatory domain-containing protein [Oscillatoria amoena NRMC-F 0135]|nr:carboxypeptidase-like regulatory domain-containing protein [Oscillatoria amoena NRMC-F 0135]
MAVLLAIHSVVYGQHKIEGRIVDRETGKPVPFASIGIVGTSTGTSSNLEGDYSLVISEGATIKISCVGYVSLVVNTVSEMKLIQLTPFTIELSEIVVTNRSVNARRIIHRAFSNISRNYDNQSYYQQFFYRHYCKDDSVYGRLIEAFVDVWKHQGYKPQRRRAGDKEEIRVTQLRRSLDNTIAAQGHSPISLRSILQADIAAYQLLEKSDHLKLYTDISNLRTDLENYTFTFDGITAFDGRDVYKISYRYKEDSIATTSGYKPAPHAKGMLYITTDTYAFVKAEELKYDENVKVKTSAFYRMYNGKYYPYHFIREGESHFTDSGTHLFHIELMSVEINRDAHYKFSGSEPAKADLLAIAYDSAFWNTHTMLKTTPLEDEIIHDLGKGISLSQQFDLYKNFEWSVSEGDVNPEEKFNWLRNFHKDKKMLYLVFLDNTCNYVCVQQIEEVKRIQKFYRNFLTVVFLSVESDPGKWKERVVKYNLFADGSINYKLDEGSELLRQYSIRKKPGFILLKKNGEVLKREQVDSSEPIRENDVRGLIEITQ